ncbi:MAG: isoprenylcysteine carboxylmethyltransferase family protein [Rhodospirillales bacterium]|nr:isoprenylcysteine carboxylmethyltransferase family protein [Rhodospirillales bacterium]
MTADSPDRDRSSVRIPPPLFYLVGLAAGLGLDYAWPYPVLPQMAQYVVGFALIAASILLVALAFREFSRAKTHVDYRKPTEAIIVGGPFAYTRNPVYVSMTLLVVGIAVAVDSLWILLMAFGAAAGVNCFVVRREETYLEGKFGDEYRRYKAAVRRWL